MTGFAYLAVLLVSAAGILTIDHRWRLAVFRSPAAAGLAIAVSVALLLTWDVLGVRSGVFFRGSTPFMTGLTVAPEIPVEEIFFLTFLSHLALVCAAGAGRIVEARRVGGGR